MMVDSTRQTKERELAELRQRAADIERQLQSPPGDWQASEFYAAYYATTGAFLGMIAAAASLLFNVVGSLLVGQYPLRIIQVYLTFPLGEKALGPEFDSGMALAVGCCLYLGTGMLLGIPFQLALARFMPTADLVKRLALATVVGLLMWLFNFYAVLSWLQPLLFEGNWIVDPQLMPPWVAALTHLVFAWTMAAIFPWGMYVAYRPQTENA
jgi:hypothetical protein